MRFLQRVGSFSPSGSSLFFVLLFLPLGVRLFFSIPLVHLDQSFSPFGGWQALKSTPTLDLVGFFVWFFPKADNDRTSRFSLFFNAQNHEGALPFAVFAKGGALLFLLSFLAVSSNFLFSFTSTDSSGSSLLLVRKMTNCSTATLADDSPVPASPDSHACSRVSPAVSFPNTR